MNETATANQTICRREKIAAYLDGDLAAADELRLEMHLAVCKNCAAELNQQKRLLGALNSAFDESFDSPDHSNFELPENFAKVVAARAESDFSGLRRPQEWMRAVILTIAIFGFGIICGVFLKQSEILALLLDNIIKIALAIGNFAVNLSYDVSLSFVVILRTVTRYFFFNSNISEFFLAFFLVISFFLLSRLLFQFPKTDKN